MVLAVTPADLAPEGLVQEAGLPSCPRAILADGLAAIAAAAPEGGLMGRDRRALLPLLLSRQKLVERLMTRGPVLPVALGTVLDDESRVRHMLTSGGRILRAALAELAGAWQMDVSVRWDLAATMARLMPDLCVPPLNAAAGAGERDSRHALDQAVGDCLDAERRRIKTSVAAALRRAARDVIFTESVDPESVVGAAVLVDERRLVDVEAELDSLDEAFEGHLTFRLVGPLAPYSFATVQVHLAPEAMLSGACAVLGVDRHAPPAELRNAYHRAVAALHPDLATHAGPGVVAYGAADDRNRSALIEEVATAYRVLRAERMPVTVARQDDAAPGRDGHD
jgi:hypothetical protein